MKNDGGKGNEEDIAKKVRREKNQKTPVRRWLDKVRGNFRNMGVWTQRLLAEIPKNSKIFFSIGKSQEYLGGKDFPEQVKEKKRYKEIGELMVRRMTLGTWDFECRNEPRRFENSRIFSSIGRRTKDTRGDGR